MWTSCRVGRSECLQGRALALPFVCAHYVKGRHSNRRLINAAAPRDTLQLQNLNGRQWWARRTPRICSRDCAKPRIKAQPSAP